ncbi:helix-turn-helix transcriptional regulator [Methanomethylovorans sp.]|uniref:helix-turn-helix transcriptional regulator n=1 Tax=Methanomethylovorans sp. TaxID=2758717 RepID=UPI00351C85EB
MLDVIFMSEKRKNTLLLLHDGAKEMEYLLKALDTTRQALLPQIKVLEEHYLISHQRDAYELTIIGKLIVDEMVPLLDITDVLGVDVEYWGTHQLEFIPLHLFNRIGELGPCTFIQIGLHEIFEEDKQFTEEAKMSGSVFTMSSFVFPNFEQTFSELIANNVNISIIISKELYEKLMGHNPEKSRALIENSNISLYVYPTRFDFLSISINDYSVMLKLLTEQGVSDNKRVICSSPSALSWGKELFDHYLKNSTPVTEL